MDPMPPWLAYVTPVATGLLVLVTIANVILVWFYTVATQRMVQEMRASRSTDIMPKLIPTLQITYLDAYGSGHLRVVNAGLGPAFKVDVDISLEPAGQRWDWKPIHVVPGEGKAFTPLKVDTPGRKEDFSLDELTATYRTVRLYGTCENALGDTIPVNEEIDIREYWQMRKAARAWVSSSEEPGEAVAEALREIRNEVKEIRQHLTKRPF